MRAPTFSDVDAHRNGDCRDDCRGCELESATSTFVPGVGEFAGYFVDVDVYDTPCVWRRGDGEPLCVLNAGDVDDDTLWAAIVATIGGAR
ncbi:hypothetical protein [Nocardioides sp. SYSU DS0663]|uniref:hypothetical protein n=1 Tax=Nocardioides sp. SYSU DS0663 TaxID=3416445 RepID=UPI003F4C05E2